jgi:hypothetical protein
VPQGKLLAHPQLETLVAKPTARQLSDHLGYTRCRGQSSSNGEERSISPQATCPPGRRRSGHLLTKVGKNGQLTDEEAAALDCVRDRSPARAVDFE